MAENQGDTIIKKVKKGGHGGHHGGAWKVAYADFVTAMMAFFLLLWLLNATTEEQKMGISNYFDPTAISRSSRSGSGGVLGGTSITVPGALKSPSSPPMLSLPVASRPQAEQTDEQQPDSDDENTRGSEFGKEDMDGQTGNNTAFTGQYDQRPGSDDGSVGNELGRFGERFGDAGGEKDERGDAMYVGREGVPGDQRGQVADDGQTGGLLDSEGEQRGGVEAGDRPNRGGEIQLSDKGGGRDDVNPADLSEQQLEQLRAEAEKRAFERIAEELRQALQQSPDLFKLQENLVVDNTPQGLRIQLVDQDKNPMFPAGSSDMSGQARQLMALVSRVLDKLPDKKIIISGHTDATPFANQSSRTNWELSTERANASRRALINAGLDPARIGGIIGKADTDPLVGDDPFSPRNRRISIVVMHDTEQPGAGPQPVGPQPTSAPGLPRPSDGGDPANGRQASLSQ